MSPTVEKESCNTTRTFDLVIFDFDGVIIDSAQDLAAAARHSLLQLRSGVPAFPFIRNCIGGGARNLLLRCLDEDKKDLVDEAMAIFRIYYEQHCTDRTVLFPGVRDVLEFYSHHKRLALATGKIRTATYKILAALNIDHYFDVIVTADDVQRPKPDPECINYVLQKLHCASDTTILIGDTPTDLRTAKNAAISSCAVLYGIGSRRDLDACNPDFIVENILELKNIATL